MANTVNASQIQDRPIADQSWASVVGNASVITYLRKGKKNVSQQQLRGKSGNL